MNTRGTLPLLLAQSTSSTWHALAWHTEMTFVLLGLCDETNQHDRARWRIKSEQHFAVLPSGGRPLACYPWLPSDWFSIWASCFNKSLALCPMGAQAKPTALVKWAVRCLQHFSGEVKCPLGAHSSSGGSLKRSNSPSKAIE